MKKTVKTIILIVLSMLMCLTNISAYATESENAIMPRLSHLGDASFTFLADASGGHIDVEYTGYPASFLGAKLTVKVEKRFLLVFWNEVGTWTSETSTEVYGSFYHVMPLNGSGTYRATFTLEVLGTDGTLDVITDTLICDY